MSSNLPGLVIWCLVINFVKFLAVINLNTSSLPFFFLLLVYPLCACYTFFNCPTLLDYSFLFLCLHFSVGSFYWHFSMLMNSFLLCISFTDEPIKCSLHFYYYDLILSISFWLFLRVSIFLLPLPICSCMLFAFSIRLLSILTVVILGF